MSQRPQVLVVDDDVAMCGFLRTFLGTRSYRALTLTNADDAVRSFHAERPAAVLLDVIMPGMGGLGALTAFRKIDKGVPVIVMSGEGRTSVVVEAMRLGATDFVCKPIEEEELASVLEKALKRDDAAVSRGPVKHSSRPAMHGRSKQMLEVHDLIERVSDTDVTVLIRGESGTGKELVARALHNQSLRREKPFVKVNCAALPTELLESELFGFEKGAFTGAIQQKPGKFEVANHGTLFLDEIGDMSFPLQAKLLQALQDGEFSRLGARSDVRVDVRVIAATNCDLESAVAAGRFREDLYFRLNVVTITLPPLRERREEIPYIVDHFMEKYSAHYNKPSTGISPELSQLFMEYDWPGNIRQLENLIKRMVVLGSETPILRELEQPASQLNHRIQGAPPVAQPQLAVPAATAAAALPALEPPIAAAVVVALPDADIDPANLSLKDIARNAARGAERELILQMLTRTRWNRKEAAQILGISYKALLYKIKESGLDKVS